MSFTTPSLPAELPPYSFVRLLAPVYGSATSSSSNNASTSDDPAPGSTGQDRPTSPSIGSSLGRISQLVSGTSGDTGKATVVRSVDAAANQVWISSSDGKIRAYEADDERFVDQDVSKSHKVEALELLDEHVISTAKKSLDRIHVSTQLNKAIILSEGQLSFHSLPAFAPLPASAFPIVKGVTAFAIDEDMDRSTDTLRICVVKRRSLHILVLRKDGASSQKDLPLHLGGTTVVAFRRNHICMADPENYSIVDIGAATAIPLMPITQSAGEDSQSEQAAEEVQKYIKTHHRPAIACVGTNEFLFASHTGTTTLGVFVNEAGEPCRGTLEWASNVRSLAIDGPHTIALLHNDSIEIHSLQTQEIVQVLSLTAISMPTSLQPRSLAKASAGLGIGAASIGSKVNLVEIQLVSSSEQASSSQQPRTRHSRSVSSASSATLETVKKKTDAHVLLVCRNGLHALAPSTLMAQVEAFFEKDRIDEAVKIAEEANDCGEAEMAEMRYVYMKAAWHNLRLTFFQVAFDFLLKSRCDPRLVIRMFPETYGELIRPGDGIEVPRGVRQAVSELKTAETMIMENLEHNYSPHIKPDVETAASTIELKDMLISTARDCLQAYLSKWRALRRGEGLFISQDPEVSHRVDMVVYTVLAKLLVERGATIDLLRLLEGQNDCILDEIEPALIKAGMYHTLAATRYKRSDVGRALEIWTSIIDGEYVDSLFSVGPEDIYGRLMESEDAAIVEKYGVWLVRKQRDLGLKLLTGAKHASLIDTRTMFSKIKEVDAEAADAFLESVVLQKRSTDATLLTDLVKRYLDRLQELLQDEATRTDIKEIEKSYVELVDSTSSPPSFAQYLVNRLDAESKPIDRIRLKVMLFLASTNTYDVGSAKAHFERLEQSGCRGLTLERAIVYGKSEGLDRQALSLLLFTLRDIRSVEAYVHQCGNPLMPVDVTSAAAKVELTLPRSKKTTKQEKPARRRELAKMVADLTLTRIRDGGGKPEMAAKLLNAYGLHLDTLQILSLVPDDWPVPDIAGFLERALRRSSLAQNESTLLKNIAASQNLDLSDKLFERQRKMGPHVERDVVTTSGGGGGQQRGTGGQTRPTAGTRRKSSVVKIETPLAFKDEGDVLELKPS